MKKLYLIIILLTAAVVFASAQQPLIKLQGHVFNHNTGAPIPGQTVIISIDSLSAPGNVYQVITDETGLYIFEIPYKTGSSYMPVYVSTHECNGTMVTHVGFFYPDILDLTLDYSLCSNQEIECVAKFKIQTDYNDSSTFYFMDGSYTTSGANIFNYSWDFGDGTSSTEQSLLHTFNKPGLYNVCLHIVKTSDTLCGDSFCLPVQVGGTIPAPCGNSFWYQPDSSRLGYTFEGYSNNNQVTSWNWDFGDGTTATGQQVEHTFLNTGVAVNVCLTTIGIGNSANDTCKSISCQTIFPGIDSSSCKAIIIALHDSSSNSYYFQNGSQGNYSFILWDFGDGGQSVLPNPFYRYLNPGIYKVCLTVGNSLNNCRNQSCQEIYVDMIQPGCQASFTVIQADSSTSTNSGLMFFNTSAPGFTNQQWSFGDGTGSSDLNPVHTYAYAGVFEACLTIWDSLGKCQSNYCRNVYVGKVTNDNAVSGIALAGNKVADQGIVWLISSDNTYNAELLIDSTGTFHFTGVPYGKYYIYTMLTPGSNEFFNYMPTYYPASLSWQGATLINTGEPNAWYKVILVPSMYWNKGEATITGTISWSGDGKADTNPAANVEVVLYNSTGYPISYTFSNSDGIYEFNNLPYGEYTLQAEMPGKTTQLIPVSLSESTSNVNIDFKVNESAIYFLGIDNLNKAQLQAGNPYPNPVGENLYLKLNASASGTAIVDIMDLQGRIILTQSVSLPGGSNRISVATGNLNRGIYLLRINSKGYKPVQRRFIK